jgi:hypothetical protein
MGIKHSDRQSINLRIMHRQKEGSVRDVRRNECGGVKPCYGSDRAIAIGPRIRMSGLIRPGRMKATAVCGSAALSVQLRVNFEADQNGRRIGIRRRPIQMDPPLGASPDYVGQAVAATEDNVAEMCEGGVLQCQIACGSYPV